MYKKVELKNGFVGMEHEVAKKWKEKDIIKKNFAMNEGKRYSTFYDGPPTANGKPHVGHIETRVMKDIIPRYKVMKGYHVDRKAGWDTHGLPVELEIEKKLGISGKEQIEEYGVEKFVKECKESVFTYVHMWEEMTNKVGYWVDMEHPYVTYHNDYIESVWWALSQLWKKGLLYEGHKVMPYCPRCGTALSSHEVAQGYKDVKDLTCIAKFKVLECQNIGNEAIEPNTYILAWTTTPWTLPSNLALCVNKSYTYAEVKALASGNPLILEKFKVENELKQLYLSKSRYDKSHIELESKYNTELPRQLKYQKQYLNGLNEDIKNVRDLSADNFEITIRDKIYTSRKDASTMFYKSLSTLKIDEETKIGEISGFDIVGLKDSLWYKPVIYIKGVGKYKVETSNIDEIGNILKLENMLKSFINKIDTVKEQIAYTEKQLIDVKEELDKPFTNQERIRELQKEKARIDSELDLDKQENTKSIEENNEEEMER